jgi:hypothetical protein
MLGRASVLAIYVARTEERTMAETHGCQPPRSDSYHEASWRCEVCGKRWVAKPYHRETFGLPGDADHRGDREGMAGGISVNGSVAPVVRTLELPRS